MDAQAKNTQATLVAMQKQLDEQASSQSASIDTVKGDLLDALDEVKLRGQQQAEEQARQAAKQDEVMAALKAQMDALMTAVSAHTPLETAPPARAEAPPLHPPQQQPVRETPSTDGKARSFNITALDPLPKDAQLQDFRDWREAWDNNAGHHNLEAFPRKQQVNALLTAIGPHASRIIRFHCKLAKEDNGTTVPLILDQLNEYYRERRNIALDRVNFHQRRQGPDEDFDQFQFALLEMAEDAALCSHCVHCREDQIVTQIIVGCSDEKAKGDLLQERPFPTLAKAIQICQASEVASKNKQSLEDTGVNRVSAYRKDKNQYKNKGSHENLHDSRKNKCQYCGGTFHEREKCHARDKTCTICKKVGHFSRVCRSKGGNDFQKPSASQNRSRSRERKDKSSVTSIFCGRVSDSKTTNFCSLKYVDINILDSKTGNQLGHLQKALPDSGAGANLMSAGDYKRIGQNVKALHRTSDVLYAANGLTINVLGKAHLQVQHGNASVNTTFIITDEYDGTILNLTTCQALHLIPADFPKQQRMCSQVSTVQEEDLGKLRLEILEEFHDVFDSDGLLKPMSGPPIHIELCNDAKPYRVNGPRPIPIPLREDAHKLIKDMMQKGVLVEVNEPTDWLHPMTVVRKPNGSLRLCVDLRMLNKFVKRPYHPVRTPKDAVSAIPPASKYFSTFDAKHGYFQVELDEESQELTTFITPWGRFKHMRATMGLSCAGDEYNRRTDAALAGLSNMEKVVDDILIHGEDLDKHLVDVKAFLTRCREAGITLNPAKFKLGQAEVKFAGYLVSNQGIKADPEKLKAIRNFPKPGNITDLRSFIGLAEQLAGFSSEVSGSMQPLRPLLSSKAEFIWTQDHDLAFEATKAALLSPPVLTTFDPKRPTMLQTDASRTKGLGYALLQQDEKEHWCLIEAGSRFISETI